MATPIEEARKLAGWGFNVLPAKPGGNHPQVDWKEFQERRTDDKLNSWFAGLRPRDYWIATGMVSHVVVLDCDNAAADRYWRDKLGDALLDGTPCAQTKRGFHYYFRLDEPMASWSVHSQDDAEAPAFDVRADKTGVIAPPSQHKRWIRDPDNYSLEPVPDLLRKPSAEMKGVTGGGGARSMLSHLLESPGAEGRNIWLSRVAGHYALEYKTRRDAFLIHCSMANTMLSPPLEEAEFSKTIESIWSAERAKEEAKTTPIADAGWLISGGNVILTQTVSSDGEGKKKSYSYDVDTWADFDMKAIGVVEDEDAPRVYDVEVSRERYGDVRPGLLPARVLADPRQLTAWLAEFGVTIAPPENTHPKGPVITTKLTRYLEAQKPPHFKVVDSLGWHNDGFVVHEGVIRGAGLAPHSKVRPHVRLRNWAPYRYGFRYDIAEARAVLNEILTFHDETVCSVFGAWWAACLLKPQIHQVSSQFPFMALEAPSESGKTTGFFAMLLELSGNTQGNVNPTRAALRDYMSAHQSGIVWIDDLDDVDHLMELLRQATGEGSVTKKGEDRQAQEAVQLVAPIAISGESLGLRDQKALADRAIQLEVQSPTQRRSQKDPTKAQWLDILALKQRYPDLTDFAGTVVQMALAHAGLVESLPSLAPPAGGRFGDKVAVLRLGAHLLAALTGNEEHIDRVEAWTARLDDTGSENTLTLRVLPTALQQTNWPKQVSSGHDRWPATPALVDTEGVVWFSPALLAQWWDTFRGGRTEQRTESAQALEQQARALGLGGGDRRKRFNVDFDRNKKVWLWEAGPELSSLIIGRSRGDAVNRGVHPEMQRLSFRAFTHPDDDQEPDE